MQILLGMNASFTSTPDTDEASPSHLYTSRKYRRAFLACRKHRVDLSVLVAQDSQVFISDIEEFTKQVHEVDHLNLFLAQVGCAPSVALVWNLC